MDFEDLGATEQFRKKLGVEAGHVLNHECEVGYKQYSIRLGESDIASVILAGCDDSSRTGTKARFLRFRGDGSYNAWLCDDSIEVPEHYKLIHKCHTWLKVYDDSELVVKIYAGYEVPIKVFRAGDYGCLIKVCK